MLRTTLHAQTPASKPSAAVPSTPPPSSLPATPPTTGSPATPALTQPPASAAQRPPHRADISFNNGLLTVDAANSSLNQILREISRLAAIKVTGGVAEERVYGNYGPARAAEILNQLLEGTGSNMLLVDGIPPDPSELILTPRQGAPTPPSPSSFNDDATDPADVAVPDPSPHARQAPPAVQPSQPQSTAPAATPGTVAAPPPSPAGPFGATPPATTTDQSVNGVKTPQQIYEQLQRLKNDAPPPPPPQ